MQRINTSFKTQSTLNLFLTARDGAVGASFQIFAQGSCAFVASDSAQVRENVGFSANDMRLLLVTRGVGEWCGCVKRDLIAVCRFAVCFRCSAGLKPSVARVHCKIQFDLADFVLPPQVG